MREIQVEQQTIPARTKQFRSRRIILDLPDGGPYVAHFEREEIIFEKGIEVSRRNVTETPVRRDYDPSGAGLTDDEKIVMAKMKALGDEYSAADGEA